MLTRLLSCAVDLSNIAVPGECLEGGFHSRILVRGIGPVTPMVAVCVIGWIFSRLQGQSHVSSMQNTLPLILFISFVLVAPTSSSIFAAWTCETFALNSIAKPPTTTAFLLADLSLKCDSSDAEYARVESLAYVFVGLWPIGVPLLFLLVLLQCRAAISQGRVTRLVRATSFLHREYDKQFLSARHSNATTGESCCFNPLCPSDMRQLVGSPLPGPTHVCHWLRSVDLSHATLHASDAWHTRFFWMCAQVTLLTPLVCRLISPTIYISALPFRFISLLFLLTPTRNSYCPIAPQIWCSSST